MDSIWQTSVILLWVGFAIQCALIVALLRYLGVIVRRLPREGLPVGDKAPARTVTDRDGHRHALGRPSDRTRVLVFMSPGCSACDELADELAPFADAHRSEVELIVLTDGQFEEDEAGAFAARLNCGSGIRLADAPHLIHPYQVPGTPFATVLNRQGVVLGSSIVNHRTDLETLIKTN